MHAAGQIKPDRVVGMPRLYAVQPRPLIRVSHASYSTATHFAARNGLHGCLRAASSSASTTTANDDDGPPPGCARYSIEVPRPIGLVLQENKNGTITVAEIAPDGNAARTGMVRVGDQLIATSGLTYTTEQQYQVCLWVYLCILCCHHRPL